MVNLVNKKVRHISLGIGTVIVQEPKSITVKFKDKTIPLQYPEAFEKYLVPVDESILKDIKSAMGSQKKLKESSPKSRPIRERQSSSNSSNTHRFSTLDSFITAYYKALHTEAEFVRTSSKKRHLLTDGVLIDKYGGKYVYTFESEEELTLPDSSTISLWIGGREIPGVYNGCEDQVVIIISLENLGDKVPSIEFSAEPWRLLKALASNLAERKFQNDQLVEDLINAGTNNIDGFSRSITTGQDRAVEMSLNQPITFVWGPPGTGKTTTLAKIAAVHINKGRRVLMVSYSNVSVDGAIKRLDDNAKSLSLNTRPGRLVRYGYPRDKELVSTSLLASYNLALHNNPDLLRRRQQIEKLKPSINRFDKRYASIRDEIKSISKKLKQEEQKIVENAKFVATTISKLTMDKALRKQNFDVVLLDEASMAYIPQIIDCAGMAQRNFVCLGDFRQLPPIVQSSKTSYLNGDIFEYCGITDAVNRRVNHKWLCLLDVQHRMHSEIADFVNERMYNGLLKTDLAIMPDRQEIANCLPASDSAIAMLDLSCMLSTCQSTRDKSHFNVLSAMLAFMYAQTYGDRYSVGIITPYRAQAKLLQSMANDYRKEFPYLREITCATVHQFQGSERDIIIYDAVDCYRENHPGMLLTSKTNDDADRLFNVAMTRARGKFIGISNIC